jgi:hypothetical protein
MGVALDLCDEFQRSAALLLCSAVVAWLVLVVA